MSNGIENNNNDAYLRLGNKNGQQMNLNAFNGQGIKKNDMNKSIFEKFDTNGDGQIDAKEANVLVQFLKKNAGSDGILSKDEVKSTNLFGTKRKDVKNFYAALNDLYAQQIAANEKAAQQAAPAANPESAQQTAPETSQQAVPATDSKTEAAAVEEQPAEQSQQKVEEEVKQEETAVEDETQPQQEEAQNTSHKYKVNYQDTWYGIVQAKYGITDHKQTMEIVRQLKAQNNVDPKATNMPKEITLPDNVTLKDGTEVKLTDIDAAVDKSHFGYKTESETGRYTITQNGKTRYYAADGTELKQSYYEAVEASPDKRQMAESGSGRYSYTSSDGKTWYFAADGTPLKEEYYKKRESEYTAVRTQEETLQKAKDAFKQQQDADGWAGKTADAISVLWNSDNRAVKVEADIKTYENQLKELKQAQSKGSAQFNAKFKEIFGVDYNPDNISAYEAEPTDENYKKAYGTKNDIHKRVMDYNKSQQDGAAAVKTTTVIAASTAAALATGGASLVATAAIAGGATMAARTAVEVSDLATNNVEGDINADSLNDIAEQAVEEGFIAGATAGFAKWAGGAVKGVGKAIKGAAPKGSGGASAAETGLAKVPKGTSGEVAPVKPSAGSSSGASTGIKSTGNTGNTGGASNAGGAKSTGNTGNTGGASNAGGAKSTGNTGNTGGASNAGGAKRAGNTSNTGGASNAGKATLKDVQDLNAKIASSKNISKLSDVEKSQLEDIIGVPLEQLSKLSQSQYRKLVIKFHPDKNIGNEEFAQAIFQIIQTLRVPV